MPPEDQLANPLAGTDASDSFAEKANAGTSQSPRFGCGPVILDFRALAKTKKEVFIRLDGETYRLCLTRNNKLILTK